MITPTIPEAVARLVHAAEHGAELLTGCPDDDTARAASGELCKAAAAVSGAMLPGNPPRLVQPASIEPEAVRLLLRQADSLDGPDADALRAVAAVCFELSQAARELYIMADASPLHRDAARERVREALRLFYLEPTANPGASRGT